MTEPCMQRCSSARFNSRTAFQLQQKNQSLKPRGKKFYPQQKFGVSKESPTYFQLKNTLIADNGYNYEMDSSLKKDEFKYFSQKHFVNLQHGQKFPNYKQKTKFALDFQSALNNNKVGFHRKKGRLSEFVDKNGWMGDRYRVLGIERCQEGRSLRKKQRELKIAHNLQKKTIHKNLSEKKLSNQKNAYSSYANRQSFQNLLLAEKLKVHQSIQKQKNNYGANFHNLNILQQSQLKKQKQSSIFRTTSSKFKPKTSYKNQFIMNIPQWNRQQFKINLIEWNKSQYKEQQQIDYKRPSTISTASKSNWPI